MAGRPARPTTRGCGAIGAFVAATQATRGQLARREAGPAHHGRRRGHLPGVRVAGLSLVDPDNRRPVDYARRRALLADLDAGRLDPGRLRAGSASGPGVPDRQAARHRPGAAAAPRARRSGSPAATPRWRPSARRRGTRSRSPGAAPAPGAGCHGGDQAPGRPARPGRLVRHRLPLPGRRPRGWLTCSPRGLPRRAPAAGRVTRALPVALLVPGRVTAFSCGRRPPDGRT